MLAAERFGTAIATVRRRGNDDLRCVAHQPTTQATIRSRRRVFRAQHSTNI
jgi:hypothetical protein